MGKSWLEWTQENLARNCDPEGIAQILLQHQFSIPDIRKMMGERFPEGARFAPQAALADEALHRKREALVAIRRALARLSPKSVAIERRSAPSGAEFLADYYAANRPVVLCGLMQRWRACGKWTPEYLKAAWRAERHNARA